MATNTSPSPHGDASHKNQLAQSLAKQIDALLRELVAINLLTEQDQRILSLRMGLKDGKCYTLAEIAALLHKSPELIRSHQYFAMRQHISNPQFFKLLASYAQVVKLPRGLAYYLQRYSKPEDLSIPIQEWDFD
ncbi:sigma factor-like helix-turn-helix DNA-binding protein [Dictyobacter aurantiacus]|uniref:RNA polymerase sigma-70 region 4 domain-containing protein n=1 Tax=Dictyobacter aurantiacus TaxID=1936993 RepID=A0A401ZLH6_9CHLR|nr:sigma factor-like helix-turn-helix DNA-binding protein [Dictyobacter aurantiacus]GCE07705.1 hypothetical protein KDAU_50340 [Dictyobacter aurantiacus]